MLQMFGFASVILASFVSWLAYLKNRYNTAVEKYVAKSSIHNETNARNSFEFKSLPDEAIFCIVQTTAIEKKIGWVNQSVNISFKVQITRSKQNSTKNLTIKVCFLFVPNRKIYSALMQIADAIICTNDVMTYIWRLAPFACM